MGDMYRYKDLSMEIMDQVDEIFEEIKDIKGLEYREGQHSMAINMVNAITNQEVLLLEAGVGIGKTYAYLIPIITATKLNKKFNGFIISTSSIALQEQLKEDIKKISEMLDTEIDVVVAKGKNNYLCQKKLQDKLEKNPDEETRNISKVFGKTNNIDKKDYENISEKTWNSVNANECNFEKCAEYENCPFRLVRKNLKEAKGIITNHNMLAANNRTHGSLFNNQPSVTVIDEAHNFPEQVRQIYKRPLNRLDVEKTAKKVANELGEIDLLSLNGRPLNSYLNEIFKVAAISSIEEFDKNNPENYTAEDCERFSFKIDSHMRKNIKAVINILNNLSKYVYKNLSFDCEAYAEKLTSNLNRHIASFESLIAKDEENICWAKFVDYEKNYIDIVVAPNDLSNIMKNFIEKRGATIFTSGTLAPGENSYNYYKEKAGLNTITNKPVYCATPVKSPYNYDDNVLLYAPTDITNPKKDKDSYLLEATDRIGRLITETEGKTLVLFTSKKDMDMVYKLLEYEKEQYPFEVIKQTDDDNVDTLKEKFKKDRNSVLFATGSFWEGIDIKGDTLSSVIIPKLPYPVDDPVIKAQAKKYRNPMEHIYNPAMIEKLMQGLGRLIRSKDDKGIISILDPRFHTVNKRLDNVLAKSLPYKNITTDIEEVSKFAKENIRNTQEENKVMNKI